MIEKLETKDLEKDLAGMITVLGNKINELIEASNEQANRIEIIEKNVAVLADNIRDNYKKIDFIMENTKIEP